MPPVISGIVAQHARSSRPTAMGGWTRHGPGRRHRPHQFGWTVAPIVNGVVRDRGALRERAGQAAAFTWNGTDGGGELVARRALPDHRLDGRRLEQPRRGRQGRHRRPASRGRHGPSSSSFISPNGDGHADRTTLSMTADSAITGTARVLDSRRHDRPPLDVQQGHQSARGSGTAGTAAGATVADGRYTFRVAGLDRAGNRTVRDLRSLVDRTIRSLTWSRSSFVPKAGQRARLTFTLGRSAHVTVTIYCRARRSSARSGRAQPFGAGSHGWTWNGRTASGALVKPGTYRVVVHAVSSVGTSSFSRNVVVRLRDADGQERAPRRRARRLDCERCPDRRRPRPSQAPSRPSSRARRPSRPTGAGVWVDPADLQRGGEPRADLGGHPRGPARRHAAGRRRRFARRHGAPGRRPRRRRRRASGSATAAQSRASDARISTGSAWRWPAARRPSSRWTPTSATTRRRCRR